MLVTCRCYERIWRTFYRTPSICVKGSDNSSIWWWFFHKPSQLRFRHVLIWGLLVSNFFQEIIMMIYPIVNLHSPLIFVVRTVSPFCNAMAFLTELTIEISDFAVLLLAIHTALSVFSTRYSAGQGLYRFRYGLCFFFYICCIHI
jgi:G protein-coupled receptor GPR1